MKLFWRLTLLVLGGVFLALGIAGIFFPILPTTPFLLLSASCFLKSSKTAYRKLMTNRVLGKYIFHYRITKAVPLKSKIVAISFLWLGILISIYIVPLLWVKVLLFFIASGVTFHISSLKTMTNEDVLLFEKEYQRFLENDCRLPKE
ncbi:MAG: ybaN [Herbinix sp.]|nr:ybaN [Herbinix sp.]